MDRGCDQFQRRINYLRVALTDRCNRRCVYWMPEQVQPFAPREQLLSPEELLAVLRAMSELGG